MRKHRDLGATVSVTPAYYKQHVSHVYILDRDFLQAARILEIGII